MKISLWREDLAAALVFLIYVAYALVAGRDAQDAEITAAHEREAYARKTDMKPEDYVALHMPIGCGTYVQTQADSKKARVYPNCIDFTKDKR